MNKGSQEDSRCDTPGSPDGIADTSASGESQEAAATYPRPLPNPRLKDYAERQLRRSRWQKTQGKQPSSDTR